ncbi:MAG TPA: pantoate--beta-alanine ligase [Candidatus Kapabacteria bacterium]|nr:pantoate--beta-alanine ligase [Candidatus Kapabacteria bacterium]
MIVIKTISEIRKQLAGARNIGFVPTMGALHEGHLSLVRLSKERCAKTVVSIFVNPTQFSESEDFSKYPRTLSDDLAMLENEGVDIVFTPDASEMYPEGAATSIDVGELGRIFEGEIRPTHFAGVATVVSALFNIVQPAAAFFGQKDLQQVAVIKKMVRDLHIPTEIVVGETIREADGLAMSSRNRYLTESEREESLVLFRTLKMTRDEIESGMNPQDAMLAGKKFFSEIAGKALIDYLAVVDPETFQIPNSFKPMQSVGIVIAAKLGATRLIDNILVTA